MNLNFAKALPIIVLLYVAALHTSMAAMETFVFLILAIVLGRAIYLKQNIFSREDIPLVLILSCLFLSSLLSLLLTPVERPILQQLGFLRWMVMLFALRQILREVWSQAFDQRLRQVWIFLTLITGLYAVAQCLTGIDLIRPDQGVVFPQAGGIYKAVGFFSFSLTFAYTMGLSMFSISLPALQTKPKVWAWLAIVFGALGVVASMSRGAWVAAVICTFFYLCFKKRRWILPFAGILLVGLFILNLVSHGFYDRIAQLASMHLDNSSSVRLDIWRGYFAMFKDYPLFGSGLFDGDKLLPAYYERLGIVQPFVSHAHNNFLQWLAGTGIAGFTFYTLLVGYFLKLTWAIRDKSPWGWSLLLAQVFFHLGGMTECNFFDGEVNHFVIFIWAMVLRARA